MTIRETLIAAALFPVVALPAKAVAALGFFYLTFGWLVVPPSVLLGI